MFQWKFTGSLPSGEIFNYGFYVRMDGETENLNDATTAADSFQGTLLNVTTGFPALYGTGVHWNAPTVTQLSDADGKTVIARKFGTSTGSGSTGSGSNLPPEVAVAVTMRTARAGKSFTGRFYLPAPLVAQCGPDGSLSSAALTAYNTALENAVLNFTSTAGKVFPIVYSAKLNTQTDCTRWDMGSIFDSQRRRRNRLVETRRNIPLPTP